MPDRQVPPSSAARNVTWTRTRLMRCQVQLNYLRHALGWAGFPLSDVDQCVSKLMHAGRLTACAWARRRPHRHCERRRPCLLLQSPSPARSRRRPRSDAAPLPCCDTPSWCACSAAAGARAGCAIWPPSQGSAQGLPAQHPAAEWCQGLCPAQGLMPCGSGAAPRPSPPRHRCSAAQPRPASAGQPYPPNPPRPRQPRTSCSAPARRVRQHALSSPAASCLSARGCLRGRACGGPACP